LEIVKEAASAGACRSTAAVAAEIENRESLRSPRDEFTAARYRKHVQFAA
jgi:hypothetical protein